MAMKRRALVGNRPASIIFTASMMLLAGGWAAPQLARASCVGPDTAVVWSYPADGDVDVPLNADLLLITSGLDWTDAVVSLDGTPLDQEKDIPGHYDMGTLKAHTKYGVALNVPLDSSDPTKTKRISWTFTTGDATEPAPASRALHVQSATGRVIQGGEQLKCSDVLFVNSCFDTGEPELDAFDVETSADVELWVIEQVSPTGDLLALSTFPAECGKPQLLREANLGTPSPYQVLGVLRDGTMLTSDNVVTPSPVPETTDAGASDAGARDAGAANVGAPDVGAPDAGAAANVGAPDAAAPVASATHTKAPDAGGSTADAAQPKTSDARTTAAQPRPADSGCSATTGSTNSEGWFAAVIAVAWLRRGPRVSRRSGDHCSFKL
jgi:hypothetical protein